SYWLACWSISLPARLLATPAPMAAEAHLPLVIFQRLQEVNIVFLKNSTIHCDYEKLTNVGMKC
ncbi:MAG: hypothetical protein WBL67_19945, partial [Nitrososphaeraceae archaeon]